MTTQKIDVNEAKRLRRIHTGKDIPEGMKKSCLKRN
jgi:hypothetical protein